MMNKSKASFLRIFRTDWWLYAIVAIACVYFAVFRLAPSPDTSTYIDSWTNSWSRGVIDSFRTPVYPLYVGLMMSLSSEHYLLLSVIGQHITFIISLIYLKRMLQWFTDNKWLVRATMLGFAFVVVQWHNNVITESFAISGTIFLFYCILSYYRSGRKSSIVWSTIWLAFLIFLRPAFLYLFPVCFLAYVLYYIKHRRAALLGMIGVAFVGILELGYCKCFENKYGFFLPSEVSIENAFQISIVEGAISPDYASDEEVKDYLRRTSAYEGKCVFDLWTYMCSTTAPEALTIKEKARIVDKSRKDQPGKWLRAVWHHYLEFLTMHSPKDKSLYSIFRVVLSSVEFLIHGLVTLYFVFCCYCLFVKKKIPVIGIILWTAVMGNVATNLIGAQAEYYRLFMPSVPLLLLMIVLTYSFVNKKLKSKCDTAVLVPE